MNRRNQILAGLLAVQLLIGVVVFWPRQTTAGAPGGALLPGATADSIASLSIADGQGNEIRLAKRDGSWVLPDAGDYPCQTDKVTTLLTKLAGLKAGQPVAQTKASHKQLKVDGGEFERRIEIELSDGTRHTLYLGTSPSYQAAHVRLEGQDAVYLAGGLTAYDAQAEAASWIDTAYVSLPSDQVVALTVENGSSRIELVKNAGQWTLADLAAGETVSQSSVQGLVGRVAQLTMLAPLGKEEKPEYGLASPLATVVVQTSGEGGVKTVTVRMGAHDAQTDSYVVASSESPYYVRVPGYSVQDLVDKKRADLLELPPTAAPTAGP